MDRDEWDSRYSETDLVWTAEPNQFVVQHLADLPPGRAVDVGCGEGRNAIWLASRGWDVLGIDFSEVAIAKAIGFAAREGVPPAFVVDDVTDRPAFPDELDLALVSYLHLGPPLDDVLRRLADRLADDGTLLVLGHHKDNLARGHGGPPVEAILHDPTHLADVLDTAGLTVTVSAEVTRRVETDAGEAVAIDSLVIGRR